MFSENIQYILHLSKLFYSSVAATVSDRQQGLWPFEHREAAFKLWILEYFQMQEFNHLRCSLLLDTALP